MRACKDSRIPCLRPHRSRSLLTKASATKWPIKLVLPFSTTKDNSTIQHKKQTMIQNPSLSSNSQQEMIPSPRPRTLTPLLCRRSRTPAYCHKPSPTPRPSLLCSRRHLLLHRLKFRTRKLPNEKSSLHQAASPTSARSKRFWQPVRALLFYIPLLCTVVWGRLALLKAGCRKR